MTAPQDSKRPFCSEQSRQRGDQLCGTVGCLDGYLLIEARHPLGTSRGDNVLPGISQGRFLAYRDYWRNYAAGLGLRLGINLIRQPRRAPQSQIRCFLALPHDTRPALYAFRFDAYEALFSLDIAAVLAGDPVYEPYRQHEPLFITCTDGKINACCARYGMPVYKALAQEVGERAWQSSHLGGCRFAGNLGCFPRGIYYGHVEPTEVPAIVAAYKAQHLYLAKYRGRLSHSPEADVAEVFLRHHTGETSLAAFRLLDVQSAMDNTWVVRFVALATGELHCVWLRRTQEHEAVFLSCRAVAPKALSRYHCIRHDILSSVPYTAVVRSV